MSISHSGITTPAQVHPAYRTDIDGLRAFAVLSVVMFHAFPSLLHGGFVGVDVFFIISGFLISTIIFQNLDRGSFSFTDFYKRRVKRIFPALLLVLVSCFVYGWITLLPADYKQLGKHIAAGVGFVSNFAFWRETGGYFDNSAHSKVLLHLWSLAIEEQYYIFWPLIAWLLWKTRLNFLWLCAALAAVSFATNLSTVKTDAVAAFYSPAARFWELLIGSMLAYVKLRPVRWRNLLLKPRLLPVNAVVTLLASARQWQSSIGVLLLLAAVLMINTQRHFPGWWALLPTLGAVGVLSAGPQTWFNRHVLSNRVMVWFGLISYPLYLWHWPLLVFARAEYAGEKPAVVVRVGAIVLAIALAWLTYRFVERPIRFGKSKLASGRGLPWLLCGLLFVCGLAGYHTYKHDGYEFRFPPAVRALLRSNGSIEELTQGWRSKECILEYGHHASEFSPTCVDQNKRPLLFLWGDSHASALYPGFKALQDSGVYTFGVAQRGGAMCPPILGIEPRPLCQELNDDSFKLLKALNPEIVVLYAWWHHPQYDLNKLDATVQALKDAGVPKIIILGSTPYWKGKLPYNLMKIWKKGSPTQKPPLYTKQGLDESIISSTARMRETAKRLGVDFISGYETLCNEQGCPTRDSEDGEQVTSYDYGHLSVSAAEKYIRLIAPAIFGAKPSFPEPTPAGKPKK
jgi:peptidoglycan/LPS O-acetylase OafA/YrhL